MRRLALTAVIEREDDGYVALCPELDIASQGESRDEARANLREAIEAFLDVADSQEVKRRLNADRHVETLELEIG